jgi:L-fuconolactonase
MIIDTHTHFYDPTRPAGVPWPSSDDPFLYRRIMPDDYKKVAIPEGVTGTIVVEASAWLEDNQWILDMADEDPFIIGLVGHLEPAWPEFEVALDRFGAHPCFYGIRLGRAPIDNIDYEKALAQLMGLNLELDLLVGAEWLDNTAVWAERYPDLRIVLNHVAHVPITGGQPDTEWLAGIHKTAAFSNVFCKVSGLVESAQDDPAPDDPAYYAPTLDALWNAFGEERLVYGGNWPVSWRYAEYAQVQKLATTYFEQKGVEVLEKVMWKNSQTAYGWGEGGERKW